MSSKIQKPVGPQQFPQSPFILRCSQQQAYRTAGPEKLSKGLSKDCRFERGQNGPEIESSDRPVLISQEALRGARTNIG